MAERVINLRSERNGEDRRFLDAYLDAAGNLVLAGQELRCAAAVAVDDDHEWFRSVDRDHLPALMAALGARAGEQVLDLLERVAAGPRSYDLERLLREEVVPSELRVV